VHPLLTKSQRIVVAFGGWTFLSLALLVILDSLSFDYFFVVCLIGFLAIVGMSGRFASGLRWRSRVNAVILLGLIIFVLFIAMKLNSAFHPPS
jgi:hypothetical protein